MTDQPDSTDQKPFSPASAGQDVPVLVITIDKNGVANVDRAEAARLLRSFATQVGCNPDQETGGNPQ